MDISRDRITVDISRDGITVDISRDGITVDISRDGITVDISRDGITVDISRDGITGYLKGWDVPVIVTANREHCLPQTCGWERLSMFQEHSFPSLEAEMRLCAFSVPTTSRQKTVPTTSRQKTGCVWEAEVRGERCTGVRFPLRRSQRTSCPE